MAITGNSGYMMNRSRLTSAKPNAINPRVCNSFGGGLAWSGGGACKVERLVIVVLRAMVGRLGVKVLRA